MKKNFFQYKWTRIIITIVLVFLLINIMTKDTIFTEQKVNDITEGINVNKLEKCVSNNSKYLSFLADEGITVEGTIKKKVTYVDFGKFVEEATSIESYHIKSSRNGSANLVDEFGIIYTIGSTAYKYDFSSRVSKVISKSCKKIISSLDSQIYGVLNIDGTVEFYGKSIKFSENNLENVWYKDGCVVYLKENALYLNDESGTKCIKKECGFVSSLDLSKSEGDVLIVFSDDSGHTYEYESVSGQTKEIKGLIANEIICDLGSVWVRTKDNNLVFWGDLRNGNQNIISERYIKIAKKVEMISSKFEWDKFRKLPKILFLTQDNKLRCITLSGDGKEKLRKVWIDSICLDDSCKYINENIILTDQKRLLFDFSSISNLRLPADSILCNQNWIEWDRDINSIVTSRNFLVGKNVDSVSGSIFLKKNQAYRYTRNNSIVKLDFPKIGIDDVFMSHDIDCSSYVLKDINDNVWLRKPGPVSEDDIWFLYKNVNNSNLFAKKKPKLVERRINKIWIDKYGVAFLKDNELYAHGTLEMFRGITENVDDIHDFYEDYMPLPNKLVKYSGINTNDIVEVSFSQTRMFITMQDGSVYSVLPKQKNLNSYLTNRNITSVDKMDVSNIKIYTKDYFIDKNGVATIKFKNKTRQIKNVEKVLCDKYRVCFVLKKNGNLIGWGENCGHVISEEQKDYITFLNRVCVKKNVVDFSLRGNALFFVDKKGTLFKRGKVDALNTKYN